MTTTGGSGNPRMIERDARNPMGILVYQFSLVQGPPPPIRPNSQFAAWFASMTALQKRLSTESAKIRTSGSGYTLITDRSFN